MQASEKEMYVKHHELLQMTEDAKACGVIMFNHNREMLLLLRKSEPFGFGLPGGTIEIDKKESSIAAAVREVYEETGIHLKPRFLAFHKMAKSVNGKYVAIFLYTQPVPVVVKLSDEHVGYLWLNDLLDEVQLAGNTREFIAEFLEVTE
jgi:8-oxo-dGTP pyrophosphatase MutT (NUDIX family)